ncbi:hypothetical protein SteCoe_25819 [Stentor coeruleus]|uniref:C2H2-type domain-containing protein n=1 Tax=Stentor coeruleus TaxID=5963 RepID=A0A1R2BEB8_9CILI|nr:hypothetical protein SteCoe_25819 [Stentor coeruleus]
MQDEFNPSLPDFNNPTQLVKKHSRSRSPERRPYTRNPYSDNPLKIPKNFIKLQDGKGSVLIPSLAGGLLSFKQFMEMQHSPIPLSEAQGFYNDYKLKFEQKHLEIFFAEHKNEPWFIEKYDPIVSQKWQEERNLNAKMMQRIFIENVKNSKFQGLKLQDTGIAPDGLSGAPYFGFDPNSLTLFLKAIPTNVSRWEILDVLKNCLGFLSLSMSEPLKSQNFARFAWVLFDSEAHCLEGLQTLCGKQVTQDFRLSPILSRTSSSKNIKSQPPTDTIENDLKLSGQLITTLDREKGIYENPLLITPEQFSELPLIEKELQLDYQLLYLRKIHSFCYYCVEEYDDERMLTAKCGIAHVRGKYDINAKTFTDPRIETRILNSGSFKNYDKDTDEILSKKLKEFEDRYTVQEEENKFRCDLCKKLFRGSEFIKKHLAVRHVDEVNGVVKERMENIMLERYLNDPCKITNPVILANDTMKFSERRKWEPRKMNNESYEDLDDPARRNARRKIVDYSDI